MGKIFCYNTVDDRGQFLNNIKFAINFKDEIKGINEKVAAGMEMDETTKEMKTKFAPASDIIKERLKKILDEEEPQKNEIKTTLAIAEATKEYIGQKEAEKFISKNFSNLLNNEIILSEHNCNHKERMTRKYSQVVEKIQDVTGIEFIQNYKDTIRDGLITATAYDFKRAKSPEDRKFLYSYLEYKLDSFKLPRDNLSKILRKKLENRKIADPYYMAAYDDSISFLKGMPTSNYEGMVRIKTVSQETQYQPKL